jgi:hypothetical protein
VTSCYLEPDVFFPEQAECGTAILSERAECGSSIMRPARQMATERHHAGVHQGSRAPGAAHPIFSRRRLKTHLGPKLFTFTFFSAGSVLRIVRSK